MELLGQQIMIYVGAGGLLAPLLFISFHLLRPIFFLPVMFICISGGLLFGTFAGTLYSIIGITLSSIIFYGFIQKMPNTYQKLVTLKRKLIGTQTQMTTSQIAILRLVPFIHFHLLSLCLIEITSSFREYTKSSIISNIPLAVIYTTIGEHLSRLTPLSIIIVFIILLLAVYLLRKKEMTINWQDFFQVST